MNLNKPFNNRDTHFCLRPEHSYMQKSRTPHVGLKGGCTTKVHDALVVRPTHLILLKCTLYICNWNSPMYG